MERSYLHLSVSDYTPCMAEQPGKILRQFLDKKRWTQDEFADIAKSSRQTIGAIIAGRSGVTPDMAVRFASAFPETTAAEWLSWDANYQLSLLDVDGADVERRARLYDVAPIREMQKRGWIAEAKTTDELEAELDRFFAGSLSTGIEFPVATLKSDPMAALSPPEKAWCFRSRQLAASSTPVAVFDPERLDACARKLRHLAAYANEAARLPEILAYYGILFVIVEPLPGARIDGAAFWLGETPVIAVSFRWDRIDAFWFTVMHEFRHIANGDAYSVDVNLIREGDGRITIAMSDDAAEQRANAEASESLVPADEMESFIKRTSPLYASTNIIQFANRIKMHPGIIVGQLQHRGELRYRAHRDLLLKVRSFVVETALTDGWGRSAGPKRRGKE
jgi:HTH-type transcriptional regulator/antitoxin HigA